MSATKKPRVPISHPQRYVVRKTPQHSPLPPQVDSLANPRVKETGEKASKSGQAQCEAIENADTICAVPAPNHPTRKPFLHRLAPFSGVHSQMPLWEMILKPFLILTHPAVVWATVLLSNFNRMGCRGQFCRGADLHCPTILSRGCGYWLHVGRPCHRRHTWIDCVRSGVGSRRSRARAPQPWCLRAGVPPRPDHSHADSQRAWVVFVWKSRGRRHVTVGRCRCVGHHDDLAAVRYDHHRGVYSRWGIQASRPRCLSSGW